ncbi:Uncharacterised protein [Vibrio cholerae]|uniref:Uncharacterized protein n=1 Tax=Vibrio cholerae TaxID=666 RepID=A0A655UWW9_VIBCL|nr:Uncharacterised protein [Vibrio cholerae]CSB56776.1 Uncharacterised protein [Vibrio cholerae]CSC16497.1 Uncharacterised protein [Vibrio cholerae]CSC23529.1 Uncharacterised protein [Vibrio cholerae]CSC55066.1 Uncharacterised protein [Vibrio cholerae]
MQQRRSIHRCRDGHTTRIGIDQLLGIGMCRRSKQSVARVSFDQLATLHHCHSVSNSAHYAQIMGNEQHRHAQFLLQRFK